MHIRKSELGPLKAGSSGRLVRVHAAASPILDSACLVRKPVQVTLTAAAPTQRMKVRPHKMQLELVCGEEGSSKDKCRDGHLLAYPATLRGPWLLHASEPLIHPNDRACS